MFQFTLLSNITERANADVTQINVKEYEYK